MPELPEVETTLRGIEPHIVSKSISSVIVRQKSLRWPVPVSLIQKKLKKMIEFVEPFALPADCKKEELDIKSKSKASAH